jgi:DNA polymerase-3 subunit epsilon
VSWLKRRLGRRPSLAPEARETLESWHELPSPDLTGTHAVASFVVVDVESSGLDVFADRLIAIGAVRVEQGYIDLGSAFYQVLRQPESSTRDNILVHGITGTEQREGLDPVDVLVAFAEFVGKTPLVGWNSSFDDIMIRRATEEHLGERWKLDWLDLAWLAPALHPETGKKRMGLDAYLAKHRIDVLSRHHALADALATAQLLLVFQREASAAGLRSVAELVEAAASARVAREQGY